MKNVKLLLSAAFATVCFASVAQDLSGPQYAVWGEDVETRRENMLANQYLKQKLDNKDYDAASGYLKKLLDNAPKGSAAIYQRGIVLFKRKYALAKGDAELKKQCVDSMMLVYDMRVEHFGAKEGKANILDMKAKDYLNFRSEDREGLRQAFEVAIEAAIAEGKPNAETIAVYFGNLCDDYKNGEGNVGAEEIIAIYDRLSPCFDGSDESVAEQKTMFDNYFGASGVASCENLQDIFSKKLAANPDDENTLAQAVSLMTRAKCSGEFYLNTAEKYYEVKPSSETALFLAQAFQSEEKFDKAIQYLNEALGVEQDPAEKEKLYVRIAIVNLATRNYSAAAQAARSAREINPENGYVYFVLAQCYAASAASCSGLAGEAAYWAAYDTMAQAVERLDSEPDTKQNAQNSLAVYRAHFPTSETCFFEELQEGQPYTVKCGLASGVSTTVRYRK